MRRSIQACGALCTALIAALPALATPPANDQCGSATLFDGLSLHDEVDTDQATVQACEAISVCGAGLAESHSVWYRFTAPGDGFLELEAFADFSMMVTIFDGCALPTQFGCIQPDCLASQAEWIGEWGYSDIWWDDFQVTAGSTYLIKIASIGGVGGHAWLDACVHPFLSNDDATHAKVITGIEFDDSLDIIGAHADDCELGEPVACDTGWVSDTVWYRYTAQVDGLAVANTWGSTFDAALSAYAQIPYVDAGGFCHEAAAIACTNIPGENGTILSLPMAAGETRWFRVDANWNDWYGPAFASAYPLAFGFGFIPTGAPANDLCSTATEILSSSYHPQPLPVMAAAASPNEPSETCESANAGVNDSVFYRFTAPATGTVSINTIGSDYDTVLSVYDGCGSMSLNGFLQPTLLACNNDAGGLFGGVSALSGLALAQGDTIIIKVAANGPSAFSGMLDFNLEFSAGAPCPADLDHDGAVTAADLSILLGAWGAGGEPDLNASGSVDSADLAILLGAWGGCA